MALMNNRRRGYFAKKIGEKTEQDLIHHAYHQGILILQIPSGCKWVAANKVVPVPTPFDCVAIWGSKDIFFDIKTTEGSTFTYSMIHDKPHQLDWLSKIERRGRQAGFLVLFRESNELVWFKASRMEMVKRRESLDPNDGLNLGPFYTADLTKIFLHD